MPLDPILAFAFALLVWAVVLAYIFRMAGLEKRTLPRARQRASGAR